MQPLGRHYLDGAWTGREAARRATVNPADGTAVGEFLDGGAAEAVAAIAAARRAFDELSWSRQPRLRAAVLLEQAAALEQCRGELATLLTAENGRPRRDAAHEINLAISELRFYAGLARTIFGRALEVEPGQWSLLAREPMGVAAIVVPWNAPVILLIRSLAPALAAGCTAVVKNAPQTALTSIRLFEALVAAPSLPRGVLNMFTESGSAGAQALVASPDVDVVSFTGSTHVGKQIMAAAAGTLKRLNLELGGSAPCVLFADADVEHAVPALVRAGLFMSGQQCVAASRLIVEASIADAFAARLGAELRRVVVGRGDDERTQMGPLIDRANRDRVAQLVAAAEAHGRILVRGEPLGGALGAGAFLTPSLVRIEDPRAPILQQEIFGPAFTLTTFATEEEAVARANDTRFGLAASIWSRDLARAQRVALRIRSGTVWLNMHGRLHPELETGGYKESGFGRLHGVQGLDEFLQTKNVAWELGASR